MRKNNGNCGRMVGRVGGWCEVWEDGERCGRMVRDEGECLGVWRLM